MLFEPHQSEAGLRRVAALVSPVDAGALPGLFAAFAGQDAETDWHGMLHGELMQGPGRFSRDDIVMGGLAADDATERHAAAMTAGLAHEAVGKREAERERDFERTGHGDALKGNAMRLELLDGAACKLVGDVLIEASLDDENRAWVFACHRPLTPGSGGRPPYAHTLGGPRSCGRENCSTAPSRARRDRARSARRCRIRSAAAAPLPRYRDRGGRKWRRCATRGSPRARRDPRVRSPPWPCARAFRGAH